MVLLLIKESYMLIVCSSKKELVGQEGLSFLLCMYDGVCVQCMCMCVGGCKYGGQKRMLGALFCSLPY